MVRPPLISLIIICGPTAVGKTSVGTLLCRQFNGEIINADSQQVYRGMDIGTAKERPEGIISHLIDIIEPSKSFDVSQYEKMAALAVKDIVARGHRPIVVGGTGLYIRVLTEGICEAPGRDEVLRKELLILKKNEGALHQLLQTIDPSMAEGLNVKDTSRMIRAIEVKKVTGKSLLELRKVPKGEKKYRTKKVGLNMERKELYERIEKRVDRMMEKGFLAEVERLVQKYGSDLQSFKAVGYKEIVAHLKGEIGLEEATRLIKQNTRRFAKRQLTWFRADPEIRWYHPEEVEQIQKDIQNFIDV